MKAALSRFLTASVLIIGLGLLAGPAFAESCACQSPCSGSVNCSGGCYAYCEENPENSGRHVCVKGCSSTEASSSSTQGDEAAPADIPAPSQD